MDKTSNVCVIQQASASKGQPGQQSLFIHTGLAPDEAAQAVALTIDRTRDLWSDKSTPEQSPEGAFTAALVARIADTVTDGKIDEGSNFRGMSVTSYPVDQAQAIIVDPAGQRVWAAQANETPESTAGRGVQFDQVVEASLHKGDLPKLLNL